MNNLTPKEYANYLFKEVEERSMQSSGYNKNVCKFLVDEIIKSEPMMPYNGQYYELISDRVDECIRYYKDVKIELEKIN